MSDAPRPLIDALSGRYAILRQLGEGGMATVYLADDLKHGRKVAVKLLKPELSAILGAERFLNEIRVTANLQHPSILPLYDSGEAEGLLYYVMPYVEGDSLRDRMDREGQLGLDETLTIAKDIAAALQFAHERGVVHRDIKPANILLQGGKPLVADFGIAIAVRSAGGERITQTGLSLGTPHYMSPEQATGDRELDARSDVYSLGAMVYEMLVGEPPHQGKSIQAIVARILSDTPTPIRRARELVPPNVDAAVQKALAKSPADRFSSAAEFAAALSNPAFSVPTMAMQTAVPAKRAGSSRFVWPALAAIATLAALAGWLRPRPDGVPLSRYAVDLPDIAPQIPFGWGAIAPDGSALLYFSTAGRVMIKERHRALAEPVEGIPQFATAPGVAFSPDGRFIAFHDGVLRRLPREGGAATTVATTGISSGPIAWPMEDTVVIGTVGRLLFVPVSGGETRELTAGLERLIVWQISPLPEGRGFLFTAATRYTEATSLWVYDARKSEVRKIAEDASVAWYLPTGHLLLAGWVSSTALVPVGLSFAPFDLDALEVTGPRTGLSEPIGSEAQSASLLVSSTGTIAYRQIDASARAGGDSELVWVARDGTETWLDEDFRFAAVQNGGIRLSPDGSRVALNVAEPSGAVNIIVRPLDRGTGTKITFVDGVARRPTWSPDGSRVLYVASDGGKDALWEARADGVGGSRLVYAADRAIWEGLWSPDGRWLVYRTEDDGAPGNGDIYAIRPGLDSVPTPISASPAEETGPALSPDGRWIAYASAQAGGGKEIFVRPFPNAQDGLWQVSSGGGAEPAWSPRGGELFYRGPRGLTAVTYSADGESFTPLTQNLLFPERAYNFNDDHRWYEPRRDALAFLFVGSRTGGSIGAPVVVVDGFLEELRRAAGERR